jgi:hypothetical protein
MTTSRRASSTAPRETGASAAAAAVLAARAGGWQRMKSRRHSVACLASNERVEFSPTRQPPTRPVAMSEPASENDAPDGPDASSACIFLQLALESGQEALGIAGHAVRVVVHRQSSRQPSQWRAPRARLASCTGHRRRRRCRQGRSCRRRSRSRRWCWPERRPRRARRRASSTLAAIASTARRATSHCDRASLDAALPPMGERAADRFSIRLQTDVNRRGESKQNKKRKQRAPSRSQSRRDAAVPWRCHSGVRTLRGAPHPVGGPWAGGRDAGAHERTHRASRRR